MLINIIRSNWLWILDYYSYLPIQMSSYHHQPEHPAEETTKQIIQDCFNQKKGQMNVSDSRYLLRIRESKEAVVYFFDPDFSRITHDIKIEYLRNKHCMVFAAKEAIYKILVLGKKSIDLYRCKIDGRGSIKQDFEKISFEAKLEIGEQFVYLSDSMEMCKHDVYIAYTNKDSFYLMILTFINKAYDLQCVKLEDQDQTKSIWNWFKKTTKPHYQTVQLQLLMSPLADHLYLLSTRQTKLMIHEVEIKPANERPKIKTIKQSMPFHESISKNYNLKELFLLDKSEGQQSGSSLKFIVVYNKDEDYNLIKVEVKLVEGQFDVICHPTARSRLKDISIAKFKGRTFASIYYNKQYLVYQCSEAQLESLNFETKALHRSANRICFSKSSLALYLVSGLEISKLAFEQAQDFRVLQELSKNYRSKINKALQMQQYQQINLILEEEYRELIEEVSDSKDKEITQKIICIFIVRKVLESDILQTFREYQEDSVNPLNQACKDTSQTTVSYLLQYIAEQKYYSSLIDDILSALVLEFIKNSSTIIQAQLAKTAINDIMIQALRTTIDDLNSTQCMFQEENRKLYLLLLAYMAEFVPPTTISSNILQIILPYNHRQIRNLIMSKYLELPFIDFFSGDQIDFNQIQLQEMAEYLYSLKNSRFQEFVRRLLRSCHSQWAAKKEMKQNPLGFMKVKCKVIVKGLFNFSEEVVPYLKDTFPGLSYFFYLKKEQRRSKGPQICKLSQQISCPSTAYIMNLSVSDIYLQDRKPILTTNKLCKDLEEKNYNAEQLVECLKQIQANSIKVHRNVWNQWKELHPQHSQEAEEIQRKKILLID